jgi:hypothetical protein
MSQYYRENGKIYSPEFKDGRTKQAFKDDTDVNKILKRAAKAGGLSHIQKHGAFYGDFADAPQDLFQAREMLERGGEIFADLPAEIRSEFGGDPLNFFEFANDPANAGKLGEILPAIAEPGYQLPEVNRGAGTRSQMASVEPSASEGGAAPEASPEPQSGSEEASA